MSGRAEPITPAADAISIARSYPRAEAIRRSFLPSNDEREGLTPRQWRNMIVAIYVCASDAQYGKFLTDLSKQSKGLNLGHDLLIIGLSGGATVAGQSTANALSAMVAGLAGSRASISKELYFDKTLPALIAGMNAARLKQKVMIYTKMNTDDVDSYPLSAALSDVDAYEDAASLDGAIAQVTAAAAAAAEEQQQKFDLLYVAPVATEDAIALMQKVKRKLAAWVQNSDKDKVNATASVIGIPANDDIMAQAQAITTYMGEHNSVAELNALIAGAQEKTKETF